jgi:hypothetical protein
VGSWAAWWGEAAAPQSPGSPAPLPSPPRSASLARAAAGRALEPGDGVGEGDVKEEGRGCAVHHGSCSSRDFEVREAGS